MDTLEKPKARRLWLIIVTLLWGLVAFQVVSLVAIWWRDGWPGDRPGLVIMGIHTKTWDRIFEVMQYMGGLVALIDIIGEARFQQMSQAMTAQAARLEDEAAEAKRRAAEQKREAKERKRRAKEWKRQHESTAGPASVGVLLNRLLWGSDLPARR